jgi:formate-dependent nitrite reductase membrane component NrfD
VKGIDGNIAELSGEGSEQRAGSADKHQRSMAKTWKSLPEPWRDDPSYYDRPMLQAPVWKPYIPLYYYVGGTSGASLVLATAATVHGSPKLDRLVWRCHWIGIVGASVSGILLIADLGRPERFLNMLRVFRPTSPMNMGAWILSVAPAATFPAVVFKGTLLGNIAGMISGIFGAGLATYTGVLVGSTAIPLWQEARGVLPVLFGASAMASSASMLDLLFDDFESRRVVYLFGMAGRAAELAAGVALERQVSRVASVARPLKEGLTGVAWKAAMVLTAASLVTMFLPKQNRRKRVVAGALGTAGSLMLRFAVHYAGARSARDPRASFHQQRAGHGAAELTGAGL